MSRDENHKKRVIFLCDQYSEIAPLEDGFQYYWVKDRGAMTAEDLRTIADELDKRNKLWQEQLDRDLSP